ncbi:MAG: hypothetical protein J7L99_01845, partial [Planctomycetes bacterium]|nr:hypothetical protein [Planctomycetota bacterium]
DLSVAFATSLPLSVKYGRQPSRATMLEAFDWYTNPRMKFRYDLRAMPYEVSRYLACSRLSIKERQWAVAQYARLANPAKSYFHLRYDFDSYRRGKPRKISKVPYTLPNLRRYGGVCIDQAYYATEVCRSLGIPATIVIGRSGVGQFHAWVACLKISPDRKDVFWDSKTGRYKSLLFYTGTVYEPAALRKILDCELMLSCQAVRLPLSRREQADAATELAKMVVISSKETVQGDLSVLKKLANLYEQRFCSGKSKKKPPQTNWIKALRHIDISLATDLISQAIERNFVYRPTWELIIKLCKDHLLPGSTVDKFLGVLVSRTAKDYPDYGCEMLLRIAPTIDDVKHRREIYRKAFDIYKRRPDLQGRILIAIGEDFERAGDKPAALRCYEQAAMRCINIADIVIDAASHVEQMFREARRTDLAIQFYGRLFSRTRKIRTAFPENTAHYQIGQRLAQLLKDAGDYRSAARVESQLR